MVCDECGKRESSIHLTKIINGKVTKLNLCEECSKKHKELEFNPSFSVHNFFSGLLDGTKESNINLEDIKGNKCDNCGMTYGKFRQMGKLGCNHCYDSFKEKLSPLLKRIHGHSVHVGKVPKRAGGVIRLRKEIENLREELNRAVKNEEYEMAAKLRDKIKDMEGQIDNN